jgi:hypothetical protein
MLLNMPKTDVEKDIQFERVTDLTMQRRPKEFPIQGEINKGELEVVFNSVIQLFKLNEESKEWASIDSGKSRLAIYYHSAKLKYRIIALSANKDVILHTFTH